MEKGVKTAANGAGAGKKAKSFVLGAAVLGIAGLIVKAIGAVYRIPLANIVGVEGMAFYEVSYPYYSWLLVVSSAGLPTAISKLVSERATRGDYRGARRVFNVAYTLLIFIGIATMLLMLLLSKPLANMSGLPGAYLSFLALAPSLFIVSVMCAYRGYLQGLQFMEGTAISQVVEQVFKLIAGFSLAKMLLPRGPEYAAMGALIGVSISELLALVSVTVIYRGRENSMRLAMSDSNAAFSREPTRVLIRSLLALAIPITIGASIMPLTGIADSAMIMNMLTKIGFSRETAQAAYSILRSNVTVFINMPAVLTMALAMSLVPAISASMAAKDRKGMVSAARTGTKLAIIIGAPCTVGLFVLGRPIIAMLFTRLDSAQLDLAQDLMRTASVGVVFLSIVQALTGILQGLNRPIVPVINLFFGGILKIITMIILMRNPAINIQGAAVSTVVCYAAAAILDVVCLIRITRMRMDIVDVFVKPILASLVMGVAVALIYGMFGKTHPTIGTLAALMVGVAVYAALAFAMKMFSKQDLAFIPGGRKLAKLMCRDKN